ncbi:MAG: sugar phosphate isomerase/epimerase family protein [Fibrobacterota bacterium]
MKFSVFTVSTPEKSPHESARQIADYGYDGIEWRFIEEEEETGKPGFWNGNRCTITPDMPDSKLKSLKTEVSALGLVTSNIATYIPPSEKEKVKRALDVTAIMGASSLRLKTAAYDGTVSYQDLLKKSREDFAAACDMAAVYGIRVLAEIHHCTITPSASAAAKLAEGISSERFGIIHDAGNMVHEGFENYQMGIEILGDYLAFVHIKNTRVVNKPCEGLQKKEWSAEWAPLDEGAVDFSLLFRALKKSGYDGWISTEDFSEEGTQESKLKKNIEFLKKAASAT